jgi:hypothetical protein
MPESESVKSGGSSANFLKRMAELRLRNIEPQLARSTSRLGMPRKMIPVVDTKLD